MRIAMIGCMVMNREISLLTAKSENIIRVWWLRQGLHDTPDVLRAQLQKTIDEDNTEPEVIRLALREAVLNRTGKSGATGKPAVSGDCSGVWSVFQRRDRSAKPFASDYRAAVR